MEWGAIPFFLVIIGGPLLIGFLLSRFYPKSVRTSYWGLFFVATLLIAGGANDIRTKTFTGKIGAGLMTGTNAQIMGGAVLVMGLCLFVAAIRRYKIEKAKHEKNVAEEAERRRIRRKQRRKS